MMNFFRKQEVRLTVKLLKWHYGRQQLELPGEKMLEIQAEDLVDDAHRIARDRGKNVLEILKDLVRDLKK